jgi:MFS family permease
MRTIISSLLDRFPFVRRHLLTIAFLVGFVVDLLTLNNLNQRFDQIILTSYVLLAMLSITLHYAALADRLGERVGELVKSLAPTLTQYAFGGLLSGMLIFYGRSGSWADSWPYLLLIVAAVVGNETIRRREQRLVYNLTIFFIGLFSYVVLMVPVFLGRMGDFVFVGSGLIALLFMYWFVSLLMRVVPHFMALQKRLVVFSMGLVFATLNGLYFTNLIPPIPLSLTELGIYHSVVRFPTLGYYEVTYEKPAWWEWYRDSDRRFRAAAGDSAYCFASVFAPTSLTVPVSHRWEYYDPITEDWREHATISYTISGERNDGYRGFTSISNYVPGRWRCSVVTERGQVLGRETFMIETGPRGELVTDRR